MALDDAFGWYPPFAFGYPLLPLAPHVQTQSASGQQALAQPIEQACTEEMARQAVQSLRSGFVNARKAQESNGQQRAMEREAIDGFIGTPYGQKSYSDLHEKGYLVFPVCTPAETGKMSNAFDNFYPKDEEGGLDVGKMMRKYSAIDSQRRWMVDATTKALGDGFEAGAEEASDTMACVLQALEYGLSDEVEIEKMTVLISAPGEQSQRLHRDQIGATVDSRLRGEGRGKMRQSAPYSGLFAFQKQAFLHIIDSSHKDFEKQDGFDWKDVREIEIPPGHAIIFHGCLVHAGSTYSDVNGRLHIYFKSSGGSATADGNFCLVGCVGSPPRARGA